MAYRDDLAALEARKAAAEAELVEKTRARDEAARLVDEARYLARAEAAFAVRDAKPRAGSRHRVVWLALAGLVVGSAALAVHGRSRPAAPPVMTEVEFFRLASYARAMCGCAELESASSPDCARQVADDMTRWGSTMSKDLPKPPELDAAQQKRVTAIFTAMGTCMGHAMAPPAAPIIAHPDPTPCDEVSCVLDNYEGACCAAFKKSTTRTTTHGDLPEAIDRSMISTAIASVRARVSACGDKSSARGKVKLHVRVGSSGQITTISVEVTPDPQLGACVAAAVRKATFAKTQSGGSFSYPFVF